MARLVLTFAATAAGLACVAPVAGAQGSGCAWDADLGAARNCGATPAGMTLTVSETGNDTNGTGAAGSPVRSISKALTLAGAGPALINVESGDFGLLVDSRIRSDDVVVRGTGPVRPTIAGAKLYGSQHLRFENVKFTARVLIAGHGTKGLAQPPRHLSFGGVEMTAGCLQPRNVEHLVIEGSWLHDCTTGVSMPTTTSPSSDVVFRGNRLESFTSDAMLISSTDGLQIDDNVIREIRRPAGSSVHNDGIQLYGGVQHVVLERNEISGSTHQLLFIADDAGPNDDVFVRNNLIYDAGAYAVQVMGATKARFVANTVWDSRFGGLLLRAGRMKDASGRVPVPQDTVVANNILSGLTMIEGVSATLVGNAVAGCDADRPGVHCLAAAPFVNGFALPPNTGLRGVASAAMAPAVDLKGASRALPAAPGAIEPDPVPPPAPAATVPTATAAASATNPTPSPVTTPSPSAVPSPPYVSPTPSVSSAPSVSPTSTPSAAAGGTSANQVFAAAIGSLDAGDRLPEGVEVPVNELCRLAVADGKVIAAVKAAKARKISKLRRRGLRVRVQGNPGCEVGVFVSAASIAPSGASMRLLGTGMASLSADGQAVVTIALDHRMLRRLAKRGPSRLVVGGPGLVPQAVTVR